MTLHEKLAELEAVLIERQNDLDYAQRSLSGYLQNRNELTEVLADLERQNIESIQNQLAFTEKLIANTKALIQANQASQLVTITVKLTPERLAVLDSIAKLNRCDRNAALDLILEGGK